MRAARKSYDPHLPPVEKVELTSAHSGRRMTLALVLLGLGAAALVYALMLLYGAKGGWQAIDAEKTGALSCAGDFSLTYELGAGEEKVSAESRALKALYTDAAERAYALFSVDAPEPASGSLAWLNAHPNEDVTLDPGLYKALEEVAASGDRTLYMGPAWGYYENVFACEDDAMTADFDPAQNEDMRVWYAACAAFANDPASVDVELLGDDMARLKVSEAYLAFAEENELDVFLDFGWMKNAFIADYLADTLLDHGYTRGALSSFDGFHRCLDDRDVVYGLAILDRTDADPIQAAAMTYAGQRRMVSLRDYPVNEQDAGRFYAFQDGQILTPYMDPADGLAKCAVHDLTGYSDTLSCGELALKLATIFVADSLDEAALEELAGEGVYAAWCEDGKVLYTDPDIELADLYETDEMKYEAVYAG